MKGKKKNKTFSEDSTGVNSAEETAEKVAETIEENTPVGDEFAILDGKDAIAIQQKKPKILAISKASVIISVVVVVLLIIASIVAKESNMDKSVHMHTDDFFHYLSKGAIPPHLPESNEQNLVVIEAFLEAAKRYARGGYDVIVDGIIGPWFLKPWQSLVREHYEVHYIILRASKEETLKRAVERSKLDRKTNIELVETMWEQFCNLGIYESNVVDTTTYSIQETVSAVQEKIASRAALLS